MTRKTRAPNGSSKPTKGSSSRRGGKAGAAKALPKGFIDIDDLVAEHERDPEQKIHIEAGRKLVAEQYAPHIRGLAALRLRRGWSQRTLADAIGVKQPHIARLESGHNDPSLSTMRKLAVALGVTVEEIAHQLASQEAGEDGASPGLSGYTGDPAATLLKAAEFAAHKHRHQRRKDAEASPYINHPIALANVLCTEGGITDPVILSAALLHDTIEDTDTDYEELRGQFGEEIADVVVEVTDTKWLSTKARKRLQVSKAPHSSTKARAVKIADKICNLRDILGSPPAGWSLSRKQTYFDWAKEVVDGVRGNHPQLEQRFDALYRQRPQA
jgi:GTP diphosphokinase / guanosine-3',5'-bis(diphosphate) 3'-diphosphatase